MCAKAQVIDKCINTRELLEGFKHLYKFTDKKKNVCFHPHLPVHVYLWGLALYPSKLTF